MKVYIYKRTIFNLLARLRFKLAGYKLIYWCSHNGKNTETLTYPPSKHYVEISQAARQSIASHFDMLEKFDGDVHLQNYIRKSYDLTFMDFNAFRFAVNSHIVGQETRHHIIGPRMESQIYEAANQHSLLTLLNLPLMIMQLVYEAVTALSFSLITSKRPVEKVIFLRKKAYPDLGVKEKILNELESTWGINGQGVLMFFSLKPKYHDFFALNAFEGAIGRSLQSTLDVIKQLPLLSRVTLRFSLPPAIVRSMIRDSYRAANIMRLDADIFLGVMVDKPIFVLIDRAKRETQWTLSLNESFFYPPFRSFDYVHLDTYFAMNDLDKSGLNHFGGHIKRFVSIPFFRHGLKTKSDGISAELHTKIRSYRAVTLAAPIQISEKSFTQWDKTDVNNFISAIANLAESRPSHLFILKGKKGELGHLNSALLNKLAKLPNVHVIASTKPRLLRQNQFEDLLPHMDTVISMSHTSTTIWQAIHQQVHVIAINNMHEHSFLRQYNNLEVRLCELNDAFDFWDNLDPKKSTAFFRTIAKQVNISDRDPYRMIADEVASIAGNEKATTGKKA